MTTYRVLTARQPLVGPDGDIQSQIHLWAAEGYVPVGGIAVTYIGVNEDGVDEYLFAQLIVKVQA